MRNLMETRLACQIRLLKMARRFSDGEKNYLTNSIKKKFKFEFSCTKPVPFDEPDLEFNQSCKTIYLTKCVSI